MEGKEKQTNSRMMKKGGTRDWTEGSEDQPDVNSQRCHIMLW